MRRLPLPPVVQRSITDIPLTVTFPDGHREEHMFTPGVATYLLARYGGDNLLWHIERSNPCTPET